MTHLNETDLPRLRLGSNADLEAIICEILNPRSEDYLSAVSVCERHVHQIIDIEICRQVAHLLHLLQLIRKCYNRFFGNTPSLPNVSFSLAGIDSHINLHAPQRDKHLFHHDGVIRVVPQKF